MSWTEPVTVAGYTGGRRKQEAGSKKQEDRGGETSLDAARTSACATACVLKQIRKCQVIVIIQTAAGAEIQSAHLQRFETHEKVRREVIKDIPADRLIASDVAGAEVAITIVVLSA